MGMEWLGLGGYLVSEDKKDAKKDAAREQAVLQSQLDAKTSELNNMTDMYKGTTFSQAATPEDINAKRQSLF